MHHSKNIRQFKSAERNKIPMRIWEYIHDENKWKSNGLFLLSLSPFFWYKIYRSGNIYDGVVFRFVLYIFCLPNPDSNLLWFHPYDPYENSLLLTKNNQHKKKSKYILIYNTHLRVNNDESMRTQVWFKSVSISPLCNEISFYPRGNKWIPKFWTMSNM